MNGPMNDRSMNKSSFFIQFYFNTALYVRWLNENPLIELAGS